MKLYSIFLQGLKYFVLETLIEVSIIIALLYLGIPYFDMNVGNEHFYQIVIGVFGYYAIIKCIYYSWFYFMAFTAVGFIGKLKTQLGYSLLNAILSIAYIMLFLINGRLFSWVLNPLLASIITSASLIVIILVRTKATK